ncbi:AAA family ATPase [Priestia flexa]|uniref:AAA family ATPase n=1 Tax=Priestia flexa TaxID=86664 RepID=UPI001F4CBFA2|nr:AAA family ATPase [Priestia flexa]
MELSFGGLLVKMMTNIGLNDRDLSKSFKDFIEDLIKIDFQISIIKNKVFLYYKDQGICSLQLDMESDNFYVILNKIQNSKKKLIQNEKKYFNRYWIENLEKKSFNLNTDLRELIIELEQIKCVFYDDVIVDFNISSIKFKDYRCFKDDTFEFNNQLTVLIGKNASGKTSILDGIAVAIGGYLSGINESTDTKTITKEDVRFTLTEEEDVPNVNYHPPTRLEFQTKFMKKELNWSRARNSLASTKITTKDSNKVTNIVRQLVEDIRENNKDRKITLPVFSHHGTGRVANFTRDMGLLERTERISRFVGYKDCLKPASNYKFFLAWYRKMKLRAFELQKNIPSLDAVTHSITECLQLLNDEESKQIETIRFFEGIIHVKYEDGELMPISYLSDGYQDIIGIISDIAYRMAILNPHLGHDVLKQTPGIVLIDEVDLHLHPKWQQKILIILKEIFPKVQFVTTTHSALIISSTKENEAVEIQTVNNRIIAEPVGNPRDWYITDILANVFHVHKKPLFKIEGLQSDDEVSLEDNMQNFSNMVKEYLANPEEELMCQIDSLYQALIPSLPEDTPKRRAIDSLKGLVT